jgi:tetraprenyl-beta-curcumene synthase
MEVKMQNDLLILTKFVNQVFPQVKRELENLKLYAHSNCEEALASQAIASIDKKTFHAQGGSIYSLYPGVNNIKILKFIVCYQTISDYLDNLCDRGSTHDEKAFRQLHLAMTEALDPSATPSDYYKYYPNKNDGNYLNKLVIQCQNQLNVLPSIDLVRPKITQLAGLYSDLQTYKHLDVNIREDKMLDWIMPNLGDYPEISPWEFGAATGSTLAIFILCAMASHKHLTKNEVERVYDVYFPWICGLHILLDYFIDLKEDETTGDLNFVSYYENKDQCLERLSLFFIKSLEGAKNLPNPKFHLLIVRGLLAMYLSDKKAQDKDIKIISKNLIAVGGTRTKHMHNLCKTIRILGAL